MKLDYNEIRNGVYEVTCPSQPNLKFWTSSTRSSKTLLQAVCNRYHKDAKLTPEELDEMNNLLDELESLYEQQYGSLEPEDEEKDNELAHREASRNRGGLEYVFGTNRGKPGDKFLEQLGSYEEESVYREANFSDDYSVLEYTLGITGGTKGDSLLQRLGDND